MTTIDILSDSYKQSLAAVPYGDGELISLPTTFTSGTLLTVAVTLAGGVAHVSDRGLTADELADAGVDVDADRIRKSFEAVRDSLDLPPVLGAESWELTAAVPIGDIAIAVQGISDVAMRADGLRVLSAHVRPTTFADRTVKRLSTRAGVVPKAKMPGRLGGARQVTLSYKGRDDNQFYVQALSGRDRETRVRSYDHASGLFLAARPDIRHRVAVLQSGQWEGWQSAALRDLCQVVPEEELDDFVDDTAA